MAAMTMSTMCRHARSGRSALLLTLALITAILATCSDEDCTCPVPERGVSGIGGSILGTEGPLRGDIFVRSVSSEYNVVARARTDSAGTFFVPLGPADYILDLQVRGNGVVSGHYHEGTLSLASADTIHVNDGDTTRVDLRLSSITLSLTAPAAAEGRSIEVLLRPSGDAGTRATADSEIGAGSAEVIISPVVSGAYELITNLPVEGLPATIVVGQGESTAYSGAIPEPSFLRGSITGGWQDLGMDPPYVMALDDDSTEVVTGWASPDGDIEMPLWESQAVRLRVSYDPPYEDPGGVVYWVGGENFTSAERFHPTPGHDASFSFVESGIGGLTGTGSPFGRVYLHREDGSVVASSSLGGDHGLFRFPGLRAGRYYVRFSGSPEWIGHWYEGADSLAQATPVVISAEGQTVWLTDFELMSGASVSGVLLDARGEPIVIAWLLVEGVSYLSANPDHEGRFRLDHVPDGSYYLRADIPNFQGRSIYYPGTAERDSATVIVVHGHADITGLEFRIPD